MLYAFLLLLAVSSARAWFSCGEVQFCTRLRTNDPGDIYTFGVGRTNSTAVEGTVRNGRTGTTFSFVLTALAGDTYRVLINDRTTPRHVVLDALDGEPEQVTISTQQGSNGITVSAGNSKVDIQASPFRITFYYGNSVVAIVNQNHLFQIEEDEPEVAIGVDVWFPNTKQFYGLPPHSDNLALRNTGPNVNEPYRYYNIDHAAFDAYITQSLYGTIPVLYAHTGETTSGFFWHNSAQTFVDLDKQDTGGKAFFFSESGAVDFFVLTGPTLKDSVKQYAALTGTAPLPQYWAIGYHQSRYSYESITDVETVVSRFDENDFPLDAIWLDIDSTNEKRYFTWDPNNFGDPLSLQNNLASTGRKLIGIVDPHYAVDTNYFVYNEAEERGYFVKDSSGEKSFQGNCWPGTSSWIDFFNPEARAYYASLFAFDKYEGSTENLYFWNDMNEPAVFGGYEASMEKDAIHYGGWTHRDVHNQYGFYQTMGTYQGLYDRSEGKLRPFVLSRSHFAGSQRYTAIWTGDAKGEWSQLQVSVPMLLNEALGGLSFAGGDVGGFIWNISELLLIRWYQAGAWLPFFRAHSDKSVDRREPYLYADWVQEPIREAIRLRHKHAPYWYTVFYEHERTGEPVIKPIVYNYPTDENAFTIDYEWFVGDNILVRPVTSETDNVQVYLPGGNDQLWYDVENNLIYRGTGTTNLQVNTGSNPYFYRGGSIIPRREASKQALVYTYNDDVTLYVLLDSSGQAEGTIYSDDYVSFEYRDKKYNYLRFNYENNNLSNQKIDSDASYDGALNFGNALIYRPPSGIKGAKLRTKNRGNKDLKISYGPNDAYIKIENINIDLREDFNIELY